MNKKTNKKPNRIIASNKKARHDFTIETRFEAGIALEGWEIKSLRAGRIQLKESYVLLKKGEAWLIGAHISPLSTASTHIEPDPIRTRKLLLHRRELNKLAAAKDQKGYAIVPLDMHWKNNRAKLEIGMGKGKQTHDKRETEKRRDWDREKQRLLSSRR